jgi:excisionase family DNA binding protein
MTPTYVTIDTLADHFRVSVSTVRNWVRNGTIPAHTYIKARATYRFNLDLVDQALRNQAQQETSK